MIKAFQSLCLFCIFSRALKNLSAREIICLTEYEITSGLRPS